MFGKVDRDSGWRTFCPGVSFCHGRRQPSETQGDKSSELINQFRGKSGRRRGTFLSRSVFGFECTRSENKDLHIHAKISRARGSSRRRRRRPNPRIVCNGIFTPFETSAPFTCSRSCPTLSFSRFRGGNCPDVSTTIFERFSLSITSRLDSSFLSSIRFQLRVFDVY